VAFPETPLPIAVEISLDGSTWTDITSNVRGEQQVQITRGRSNWASAVEAGRCSFSLDNNDGRYSPRNPAGLYYGQIGRNTPVRVSVATGSVALDLPGGDGDYASTPDAAALDITSDIDVRFDATLVNWVLPDYPSAGQSDYDRTELIAKSASGQVSWALYTRLSTLYLVWSTNGSTLKEAAATADLPLTTSGRLAVRATLDVDNGAAGWTATFYTADSMAGTWTQLGSAVTGAGTTSIFSGTAALRLGSTPDVAFDEAIGRVHAAQVRTGIGGTIVANPDFTAQTSGATSFADSAGLTWSTAGNAAITDRKIRFAGEIASWTPKWDTGGKDVVCEVEAAGVLRRLGVGAVPTKSPFYREFTSPGRRAAGVVAYWPMEDGSGATSLASAYSGHPAMTMTGSVTPAAYDDWVASDPVPTVGTGSMRVTVPSYTVDASKNGRWGFFVKIPLSGVVSTQRLVSISQTGTASVWSLYVNTSGQLAFRAYNDGVQVHDSGFGTAIMNGLEQYMLITLVQDGADVDYTVIAVDIADSLDTAVPDNLPVITSVSGTVAGYTTGRITQIRFGEDGAMNGTAIGHLAVGNATTAFTASASVMVGWSGEEGPSRIARIGAEESLHAYPTGGGDEQCGPQTRGTALDVMRAAAEVDEGILCELRRVTGLRHVTRTSMYNQPAALTLSYSGDDGLVAPLAPVDDDQAVTNDVTVARTSGSSARTTLDTGPLSTLAPPSGIGLYDTSYTLDLLNDSQPQHHAGWRLHLGTWDETRYPTVTVNLANAPASIEDATAVDVGSRLAITDLPSWLPPDDLDLRVEGYTEVMDQFTWTLAYNCSPHGPWTVAGIPIIEDFEDTTFAVTSTDAGSVAWSRWTTQAHTGTYSLRSGAIANNQTSDWIMDVPQGATSVSFWYWTSSEASGAGFEGDRLLVLADATQVLRAQGSTAWTKLTVDVTGVETLTFRYIKDNSTAVGSDAVAVDDITITGRAPVRADTAGSALLAAVTSSATSALVATTSGPQWTTSSSELPFDVRVSGEVWRATAIASWLSDAYGRTASAGWGTADSGQTWFAVGGTVATDYAVGSGYGSHTLTSVNVSRRSGVDFTHADVDVYVSVTTSATATGGSLYGGSLVRYVDADNLYMLRIEFTTGNAINLDVRKRVAAVESSLATYSSPLTHVAGTFVRCRLQVRGSTLRAKVWAVAAVEPPDWHVTVTDTSITTSAFVGARSISAAANTNVNPQVRYDLYEVINPQTFTVTRSVNGVTKSQSAGASLALAQPAIAAL
jgi:hypothetical protein